MKTLENLAVDGLMSINDACHFLSLSLSTVRSLIKRGELPATQIGRNVRLSRAKVVEFANQRFAVQQDSKE